MFQVQIGATQRHDLVDAAQRALQRFPELSAGTGYCDAHAASSLNPPGITV
jgi:hypothetical protein